MSKQDRLDELNVVERPLLSQLEAMGWMHIDGADEDAETGRKDYGLLGRDTFREVLLHDRLTEALRRLNRNDDGSQWLDDARIAEAIAEIERPTATDFIAINEELHSKLALGVNVTGLEGEHERRVRFFDFEGDGNDLVAISQFRVDPPGAVGDKGFIVPDVVLFVNGIPLVVIEAKSPAVSHPIATAIDQLRRYANRRVPEGGEGAERLFRTNLLLVATSFYKARVGAVTARPDDFLPWRDVKPASMDTVRGELGKAPGSELSEQEVLAAGLLRPSHLLDALRSFTLFMTTDDGVRIKVVPRYQQFRSVHAALARLQTGKSRRDDGMLDRRGGVIWHTQGSGKSLTMVFLVRKMRTVPELRRFKVIVVTDRTDLEEQLSRTASLAGQVMRVAKSAASAKTQLARQEPDLVFVMLQKLQDRDDDNRTTELTFEDERPRERETGKSESRRSTLRLVEREPFPVLNESSDVLVLVDEAHRSHSSGLHQNLLDALPNAARIGFTGTPIEEKGKKKTRDIFGEYIDQYRLADAQADGAIVKILYEGRELQATVGDGGTIDGLFDRMFHDRSPEEREAIKNRYATRSSVINAADPIVVKAADILRHYITNILPNGFKAQLVAASRELAVQYVEALETARNKLLESVDLLAGDLEEIEDDVLAEDPELAFWITAHRHRRTIQDLEFAAVISTDHNDLPHLKVWGGATETRDRIARFKKPLSEDSLAFLVVKSKLLTGFDAKVEQAMYIDRAISGAELLQAIARTNRTAGEAKRFGMVVDYYGVGRNLAEALALYDEETNEDLDEGIARPEDVLPDLREAHDALVKLFADEGIVRGSNLQDYVDRCVYKLADHRLRARFAAMIRRLIGLYEALMPRPEARPFTNDVKIYAFIAKVASNLYRDGSLDIRGMANKVQAILDAFISANGVDPKVPPIELLDPSFADQVASRTNTRAKAAEMENAIRHHISISFDTDPAKYQSLSERLRRIVSEHHEDWEELARQLQQMVDEMQRSSADTSAYRGLDRRTEAPIFGLLTQRCSDETRTDDLAAASTKIASYIREQASVAGLWDSQPAIEQMRGWVFMTLDNTNAFEFEDLDAMSVAIVDVARANRSAFQA